MVRWPELRAAAILATLIVVAVLLLPGGARLTEPKVWGSPQYQAQFREWSALLAKIGVTLAPEELEQPAWRFVSRYVAWREPLAAFTSPAITQLGMGQGWNMFSTPQTHPARLVVELDEGRGFVPIYESRSDRYAWRRAQLDHNRVRKVIGRLVRDQDEARLQRFLRWLAGVAASDHPRASRLRVRWYRWQTKVPGNPGAAYDADGRFVFSEILPLGEAR